MTFPHSAKKSDVKIFTYSTDGAVFDKNNGRRVLACSGFYYPQTTVEHRACMTGVKVKLLRTYCITSCNQAPREESAQTRAGVEKYSIVRVNFFLSPVKSRTLQKTAVYVHPRTTTTTTDFRGFRSTKLKEKFG
jgi:hypothetical protein